MWQLEPPRGVHGQPAGGYNRWAGGIRPNTALLGTQCSWVGSSGAHRGWGGAGATGRAPHQQRGVAPETAPLGLQGNFHPGSECSQVESTGPQIGALSGANVRWGGGAGPSFGMERAPEPWQRMGDWCTAQGGSMGLAGRGVQGIEPPGKRSEWTKSMDLATMMLSLIHI